jgi:polysaccharide biosynthesis protein PslG
MRLLLRSVPLALLASLALAAPAPAVETGVNETMYQTLPLGQTAADLGADWVRLWGTWEHGEPQPGAYDQNYVNWLGDRVAAAKARGVKVLVVIARSPGWATGGKPSIAPPDDPARFAAYMAELAKRLPGVDAWEIWNEEDGAEFWLGGPQPAVYTALLKASYAAIKAVQSHDLVVTGGTIGNDMDFVEQLYAHGAQGSFDAVGVHTDTACLTDGPDVIYRDERGRVGRYTFTGYREVHAVMRRHGDGAKPIWMTELGWNTQTTAPGSCPVGTKKGTKPLGVTEEQQAQNLAQAYRCLAADPFVTHALWFGLQDIAGSAHAAGFGLYRGDGSAKPAAAAFRALDAGIPAAPCGGVVDASGPQIEIAQPLDGLKFVDMIDIDAKGVDSAGGVGIARIKMYADGKFERTFGDGHARISPWWPSRYWKRGAHTLTFKAIDEAGNVVAKSVTVHKVRRLATAANLTLERLGPSTVKVTGGIRAHASAKLGGRAIVAFQKRVRGKWKTVHRIRRRASRPIAVTQRVKPGSWRVFLRYPGRAGFKKSRSKPLRFDVA